MLRPISVEFGVVVRLIENSRGGPAVTDLHCAPESGAFPKAGGRAAHRLGRLEDIQIQRLVRTACSQTRTRPQQWLPGAFSRKT